jgi:hypothetical protein
VTEARPRCPRCHSLNVLPFEDDTDEPHTDSFTVILLSALFLALVYLGFLIFSYFNYPLMILITVAVIAFVLGRKEKKRPPPRSTSSRFFICLDCNSHFEYPGNTA